jgi:hypothetical protein
MKLQGGTNVEIVVLKGLGYLVDMHGRTEGSRPTEGSRQVFNFSDALIPEKP